MGARLVTGKRGVTTIVVGPVHAGIIEPGRFVFQSGGENVLRLDAQLGFSRRGVEAALRGTDVFAAASRVARICGACSASRSWAYALAIEDLAGWRCEEPVELARLAIAELERAYNHAFDLASACAGAGYAKGQMTGLRIKEALHRVNADAFGHRMLFDAIVPGGVRQEVLRDPISLRASLKTLSRETQRFIDDIFANESLRRRFEGTGVVSAEDAQRLGAVGPASRASGGSGDQRCERSYGAYIALRPTAARLRRGDVEARCRVKAAELSDALDLCEGALAELGSARLPAPIAPPPVAGTSCGVVEGPRGSEGVSLDVDSDGNLSRIAIESASARNWPVVIEAMKGNIVPDFPLVNKSFNLCYACADL